MKTAYISGSTIPSEKANAVHVMKMCQALARHKKAEVTLYGKHGLLFKNPFEYYGVSSKFSLVRSWFGRLPIISGFIRLIVVIVHAGLIKKYDAYYGRDAMGLLLLSFLGRAPLFYEAHQIPHTARDRVLLTKLLSSKNMKGVVVISKALEEDFRQAFPNYKGAILVAHDGADIPTQSPKKIPQKNWKGRRNTLQVGYTGSLHKGKGMELIYDIASLVPEMDFHVIGGNKDDLSSWQAKGLPSNLFMHGSKPHADIPSYLAKFDVVLAPYQSKIHIGSGADISRWISPMKLFEYMAQGKPIICSDLSVLREIITHGRNGLMASPEDPTAWADALCDLGKSAAFREALGHEGFRDVQNKYSWQMRANNALEFIQKS